MGNPAFSKKFSASFFIDNAEIASNINFTNSSLINNINLYIKK